jgi:hypothetical protein
MAVRGFSAPDPTAGLAYGSPRRWPVVGAAMRQVIGGSPWAHEAYDFFQTN